MVECIRMLFWKKSEPLSADFVETTIGRVYYKILDAGKINSAMILATVNNGVINNNLFFSLIEKQLLNIDDKKYNSLSPKDFVKLREMTKRILKRHDLIDETELDVPKPNFDKRDIEWFEKNKIK